MVTAVTTLRGVTLNVRIGPGLPLPARPSVLNAIESVATTTTVGAKNGFQIGLKFSKTSEIATTLIPGGYFAPLNRVIIYATLNGQNHVLADGPIMRQDMVAANEPGSHRLTITGEDLSAYMDIVELTGIPYPGMSVEEQVLVILAKYAAFGVVPMVIPFVFSGKKSPTEGWDSQQGTDYAHLDKGAKAASYVFYMKPGPAPGTSIAYFGPAIRIGLPQPALTLDFDTASNTDSLTFSFDANSSIMPYSFVHIPFAKVDIPLPVPDIALLKPPLAARPFVPAKIRQIENSRFNVTEVLKHMIAGRGGADPVNGSGTINVASYGRPLEAGGLVGVRGAGRAYDGMWFVKSVSNTLARGSWKQSFQISRDGLNSQTEAVPV